MAEQPTTSSRRVSRRGFLIAGAAAAGGAAAGLYELTAGSYRPQATAVATDSSPSPAAASASASPGTVAAVAPTSASTPSASASPVLQARRRYRSRPDLASPVFTIAAPSAPGAVAPGLIFLTPANGADHDGPTIVDDTGALVWMRPGTGKLTTDFRVASFGDRPVLTWWEGTVDGGIGSGEHVIVDDAYQEVARVRGALGRPADLHEFLLTGRGSAFYFVDAALPPSAGTAPVESPGPAGTPGALALMDCAIVEVDVATGATLFEWHARDHVDVAETVAATPGAGAPYFDYVHLNSIDVDSDGNLLVSARNTSTVYKVDRSTGQITWRLGGTRSDFTMGPGSAFALQHDARRQPDGTISIFDDEQGSGVSRAIVLRLDEAARTATLVREMRQPQGLTATSQGNMQVLPNGNVFVGWGSLPRLSEFAPDGSLVFDALFSATQSYRDCRFEWTGRPADRPRVALEGSGRGTTVYASWNGATEVTTWQVLAGASTTALRAIASAPRVGFETAVRVEAPARFFAAQALDVQGHVLGVSEPVAALD